MPEIIVTLDDVRAIAYCMGGCRAWATHHGLSWPDFIARGLPISVFDQLNDGLGNAVAAQARKRAGV